MAAIVAGTESNHIHQQLVPQTQTQTPPQLSSEQLPVAALWHFD